MMWQMTSSGMVRPTSHAQARRVEAPGQYCWACRSCAAVGTRAPHAGWAQRARAGAWLCTVTPPAAYRCNALCPEPCWMAWSKGVRLAYTQNTGKYHGNAVTCAPLTWSLWFTSAPSCKSSAAASFLPSNAACVSAVAPPLGPHNAVRVGGALNSKVPLSAFMSAPAHTSRWMAAPCLCCAAYMRAVLPFQSRAFTSRVPRASSAATSAVAPWLHAFISVVLRSCVMP